MKDFKKLVKEALTPHYLRENKKFEVGDKVTYLGHPGVITATEKDPIGRDFVSISYDKGTGKRKVRMILAKSDVVKAVNETKYRVEFTNQDGEKAKSRVYNSEKEADKKEKQLVDSGIKKAKVVKVEESINEGAKKYFGVFRKGGNMGQGNEKLVYSFVDKEEAKQRAKRLRNTLSPGEKSYYGMTYIVKPTDVEPESINENEAPVKVGDKLKMAYQGSTVRGKTGVVTSVSDDMAQVDFGGGDSYGILFNRIRGNEIINEVESGDVVTYKGEDHTVQRIEDDELGVRIYIRPNEKSYYGGRKDTFWVKPEDLKEDMLDKKYGKSFMDKLEAEIILKQQLGDLKSEREQIMIDMEQEAEPEGGKIADEYGSRLNDIDSRMKLIQKDIDDLRMYESVNEAGVDISLGIGVMDKVKELYQNKDIQGLMDFRKRFDYPKASMKVKKLVPKLIDDLLMKQQMDHDKETLRKERGLEESVKIPSQKDVNDFFSDTFDEMHYLNSKPVEDWDEYDLSNWAARVRKSKERGKASYDGVAMREYGVPYDELSEEEKEWVRNKIDMDRGVMEEVNEDFTHSSLAITDQSQISGLDDLELLDLLNRVSYEYTPELKNAARIIAQEIEDRNLTSKIHYVDNKRYEFKESVGVEEEIETSLTPNEIGDESVERESNSAAYESLQESLRKKLKARLK